MIFANDDIRVSDLKKHIHYFCSDALEGRLTGSHGEALATDYVAKEFKRLGLEPAGDRGTFFQKFDFVVKRHHKKNIRQGRNVLAVLRTHAKSTSMLIVGAHIDHLGYGELGGSRARKNEQGMIHPGADDNASGVASVLAAADVLSHLKAQGKLHGNKVILFAVWSGEELGVLGSAFYAKKALKKSHPAVMDAVINLDMVGHLHKKLVLQGVGSSSDWPFIIKKISRHLPFAVTLQKDPYFPTDAISFYLRGVPTINLFTGANDDYHTPRDKPDTLNYAGIKQVSVFLVNLILALEEQRRLHYREVQEEHDHSERDLRIYLGTIPDYTASDVMGVKLSGVAKNSPADKAGIKSQDVILQLAGKKIHDIYDYTAVLNGLRVGVPTKIIALRNERKIALIIVPQKL